jgi:high-affinity nickel permease
VYFTRMVNSRTNAVSLMVLSVMNFIIFINLLRPFQDTKTSDCMRWYPEFMKMYLCKDL